MKILFTSLFISFSVILSAQIKLNATDFPNPADTFHLLSWQNIAKPTNFTNQTWNYSTLPNTSTSDVIFVKEELEDFTQVGIDVYRSVTKSFNADFLYYIDIEFDLNDNALSEKGLYIPEQRYGLTSFTGNNKDSLIIPLQGYIFTNTVDHLRFPLEHKKSWASQSRRVTEFNLTVNAFNLKNVPAQHVWRSIRKDTILGFGTMQILTENGPSRSYDVLVDRIETHAIDSFYLAGQPAPLTLLNGFNISQGQKTNVGNRINFYRKDLFYYFASFFFGSRPFTAQPTDFFACTNGAQILSSTEGIEPEQYLTIYPTILSQGESINVLLHKNHDEDFEVNVLNSEGKLMQSSTIQSNQLTQVLLPNQMENGIHFITIRDNDNKIISTQKIVIK